MNKNILYEEVSRLNEKIFDELAKVENILYTTMKSCINKECNSEYYVNCNSSNISEERNSYITMLSIALEHLKLGQNFNNQIENFIIQTSMEKIKTQKQNRI